MKKEAQTKAVSLRLLGYSLKEIANECSVSKSSVSCWVRGLKLSEAAQHRINTRSRLGWTSTKDLSEIRRNSVKRRHDASFQSGYNSSPTLLDALCVGLYWGEGAKATKFWSFSNADREAVGVMLEWCVRQGHPRSDFRLSVQVHPDQHTEQEVKTYWAVLGISESVIKIYSYRSKTSACKVKSKIPCGVATLHPRKKLSHWFHYLLGQRLKIQQSIQ